MDLKILVSFHEENKTVCVKFKTLNGSKHLCFFNFIRF